MDLKEHIEKIIEKTFEKVQEAYNDHRETCKSEGERWKKKNTRLVFPRYGEHREYETRISEQELRFAFVEAFNEYCNNPENNCNLFYSVETPTEKRYAGFKTGNPECKESGRSGCIDLTIHDASSKRICLIEFKAKNPEEKDYKKDFCKLNNEGIKLCYFLQIVEKKDSGTVDSIKSKTKNDIGEAIHYCYCLDRRPKNYNIP